MEVEQLPITISRGPVTDYTPVNLERIRRAIARSGSSSSGTASVPMTNDRLHELESSSGCRWPSSALRREVLAEIYRLREESRSLSYIPNLLDEVVRLRRQIAKEHDRTDDCLFEPCVFCQAARSDNWDPSKPLDWVPEAKK